VQGQAASIELHRAKSEAPAGNAGPQGIKPRAMSGGRAQNGRK